jgi:hypothetical protein
MKDICLLALPIRSWDKLWLKLGTILLVILGNVAVLSRLFLFVGSM